MENFKIIVDITASLAAIIAIASVFTSWVRSKRKPLKIDRVVIHKGNSESKYIFVVRNNRDYPVEIKKAECFTKRKILVQKKTRQKPEYNRFLNYKHIIFRSKESRLMAPSGNTDIRIQGRVLDTKISKLLFCLETSHGYHEIWCKDISVVEVGKVETFGLDFEYEYNSILKAKIRYCWVKVKYFFKKIGGGQ